MCVSFKIKLWDQQKNYCKYICCSLKNNVSAYILLQSHKQPHSLHRPLPRVFIRLAWIASWRGARSAPRRQWSSENIFTRSSVALSYLSIEASFIGLGIPVRSFPLTILGFCMLVNTVQRPASKGFPTFLK